MNLIDFDEFARRAEEELSDSAAVTVRVARRSDGTPREAADRFVASLGYAPLGDRWFDLDEGGPNGEARPLSAPEHLAEMLRKDMVHSSYEWVPEADAMEWASKFYSYFTAGTIARLGNRIANGWNPITASTMEAAYVVVDDERVGLFLIEAED